MRVWFPPRCALRRPLPQALGFKMKVPTLHITGWAVLLAVIGFAIAGEYTLRLYAITHWGPAQNGVYAEQLAATLKPHLESECNCTLSDASEKILAQLRKTTARVSSDGLKILNMLSIYGLLGLASFLTAFLSPFCKPRWLAIPCLAIGIFSLYSTSVVM